MKKPLVGILILLFCLFGMIGISQNKELRAPGPMYAVLGAGALAGLVLAFRNRGKAGKEKTAKEPAAGRGAPIPRTARPRVFLVKLPKGRDYAVPKVCCSCLGPADGMWPATCRSAGWRYSLNIPFCKTCSKTKYPWWKYRSPVSVDVDLKSDAFVFAFDNQEYAREFSRMNGGTDPEVIS